MSLRRFLLLAALGAGACQTSPPPESGSTAARPLTEGLGADALLEPAVKAAGAAGATDFAPLGARVMFEGEQLGSFVAVPEERCLLALGRGGDSIRDVDMYVYDDAGQRLAADEAPNAAAATLLCPPHPKRVYVAARVIDGDGPMALGIMTVPEAKADAVAEALEVRGRPGEDTGRFESWPGLEKAVRERRASLGGRWEDARRVALPVDSLTASAATFAVGARRCVDILVVPTADVLGMEAYVVDEGGRVVARSRGVGRNRTFLLCSEQAQRATVMVRAQQSRGLAVVVVGESVEGAASTLLERGDLVGATPLEPLPSALERHRRRLEPVAGDAKLKQAAEGEAKVGVATAMALELEAGCTRIDVVGGEPLGSFSASLWSAGGRLRARQRGGAVVPLFACGAAGSSRLEVVAETRPGPFAVTTVTEPQPPPALLAHPVAASRLLARLDSRGGPVLGVEAGVVEVLRVDGRVERSLPADGCLDLVLAAEPPAEGIRLSVAGRFVAAEQVLSDRVCAGSGTIGIELSGPGKLLLVQVPIGAAQR